MGKFTAIAHTLRAAVGLALLSVHATAQVINQAPPCASPEAVLERYVDAVGGKAALDLQSLNLTAKESECCGFGNETEYYTYKFKWKRGTSGDNSTFHHPPTKQKSSQIGESIPSDSKFAPKSNIVFYATISKTALEHHKWSLLYNTVNRKIYRTGEIAIV